MGVPVVSFKGNSSEKESFCFILAVLRGAQLSQLYKCIDIGRVNFNRLV